MIYNHEFVWDIEFEAGNFIEVAAPTLSELERACKLTGRIEEFQAYLDFESMLWAEHEQVLALVDTDQGTLHHSGLVHHGSIHTSFQDDYEEPASRKREAEKYRLEKELSSTIRFHRERLMGTVRSMGQFIQDDVAPQ